MDKEQLEIKRGLSIQMALDMPWSISLEIRRLILIPYLRVKFLLHGIEWGRGWRIFGAPIVQRYRGSRIHLGNNLVLRSWPQSNPLVPDHPVTFATRSSSAVIEIGDECGLTGVTLVAANGIKIGNRVFIGSNTTIVDTDFHPLDKSVRINHPKDGKSQPVRIDDDVFIGMNVIVLKGTSIGRGSVIGAGSVVSGTFPPHVIAAGNPAVVIRDLDA